MNKDKKQDEQAKLDKALLPELLKFATDEATPNGVLDGLNRLATGPGLEPAIERIFDLARSHEYAAKLRDDLIRQGFWLARDGSQVKCYVKLATDKVRSAQRKLIVMADNGNKDAFEWAKTLYAKDHDGRSPVSSAENSLATKLAGKERLLTAFVIQRDMDAMRAGMLSNEPSPLERVLVDRIVYCHAAVNMYESHVAQATSMTLQQGEYHQRTIDKAHRRLLTAVETLARVRRLQIVPNIQVNIGQKQLNVGAVVPS